MSPRKSIDDARVEASAVHTGLSIIAKEFADLAKLQAEVEKNPPATAGAILVALQQDEQQFRLSHELAVRRLQDWKGDLEKEVSSPEFPQLQTGGRDQVRTQLAHLIKLQEQVSTDEQALDRVTAVVKAVVDRKPSELIAKSNNLALEVHPHLSTFSQLLSRLKTSEDEIDRIVGELTTFLEKYKPSSSELKNMQSVKEGLHDLMQGKGRYASYSEEDRKAILARWVRSNQSVYKAFSDEIQQFLGGTSKWLLSLNSIKLGVADSDLVKNRYAGELCRDEYCRATARLRAQGWRHPYPQEYFETRKYAIESQDKAYLNFIQDAWSYWEWTDIAFEWTDNGFFILWSPNVVWDGRRYVEAGAPHQRIKVDMESHKYKPSIKIADCPAQIQALYGTALQMAIREEASISISHGLWPVARMSGRYVNWNLYCNMDIGNFNVSRAVYLPKKTFQ